MIVFYSSEAFESNGYAIFILKDKWQFIVVYCFNCLGTKYFNGATYRWYREQIGSQQSDLNAMNSEEREQLVEIVKQSNEVILGEVPFHDTDSTIVTPELNLNEIVVAHVKSQCPECGKYLANVNEHMKLVHLKIRYVFSVTFL